MKDEGGRMKQERMTVKSHPSRPFRAGSLVAIVTCILCTAARAEFPTTHPFQEITYQHIQRHNPDESLYVVAVDLTDPDVQIHLATAGPDPDGDGPWQTTLQPVRQIAQREKFDVAINASYFEITRGRASAPIPEEQAERGGAPATSAPAQAGGYVAGVWASHVGLTMMDGRLVSNTPREDWPILWVEGDRTVKIGPAPASGVPAHARQIVTGNGLVLINGAKPPVPFKSNLPARHPRTAIGVDRAGTKLTILTLDGRRPGVSVGMNGDELADEMKQLGCWDAINLDGGGSTTLLMRDPATGEFKLLNQPSDNRERAVSSALGITLRR
jgi:exopolysaccharide biosynthesis protein